MRTVFVLLMIVITLGVHAQYKYGFAPTTLSKYKEQVKSNPDKKLVNLEDYIPNIVLDIRSATTNNFTGEKIYNLAKAYARKPTFGLATMCIGVGQGIATIFERV
jgi:D-alanyl-D-alanine dipeptidase